MCTGRLQPGSPPTAQPARPAMCVADGHCLHQHALLVMLLTCPMSAERVHVGLTTSRVWPGSNGAPPNSPAHRRAKGAKFRFPTCIEASAMNASMIPQPEAAEPSKQRLRPADRQPIGSHQRLACAVVSAAASWPARPQARLRNHGHVSARSPPHADAIRRRLQHSHKLQEMCKGGEDAFRCAAVCSLAARLQC